jgi:hypothetical protein
MAPGAKSRRALRKEWVRRGGCAGESGVALGVAGDQAAFSADRQGRGARRTPANYLDMRRWNRQVGNG